MEEKMIVHQIEQLTKDPIFTEKARKVGSSEMFYELLAREGIELDYDLFQSIVFMSESNQELNEQELEDVAGGMVVGSSVWLIKWWKSIQRDSSGSRHGGGGRSF